jgi:hypothetical protein
MITDTDSGYDDGDYIRRVFYDERDPYEVVVIRITDDHSKGTTATRFPTQSNSNKDDVLIITEGYVTANGDPEHRMVFREADVSFIPVSIAGLGERSRINGLVPNDAEYDDVPTAVRDAFKTDGFCLVPAEEEWPL